MRLLLRLVIILAVTAVLYVAVDLTFGYVVSRPRFEDWKNKEPVPGYQGQSYATADFRKEASGEPGEWRQIYGTRLVTPPEFHGRYFNVDRLPPTDNLYRRTANPPTASPNPAVVLLLGGSTVYGPAVPDDLTLASLLSARLNELDPARGYRVINAGVFAADSLQDRERLAYELSRGLKPDIVIAYGGGMDIADGVYQGDPGHPGAFQDSRTGLRGLLHRFLPLNIFRWLRAKASEAAASRHDKVTPEHLETPAEVARLTAATASAWFDNQRAMDEMARKSGARFISILQPSPYSTAYDHPTADIPYVQRISEEQWPGMGAISGRVQEALAKQSAILRADGIEAVDMSAVLRAKTEDVFIDIGHLNATGHRMMATAIADVVLRRPSSANP
jgi:lysophospholipase L1-like esterase